MDGSLLHGVLLLQPLLGDGVLWLLLEIEGQSGWGGSRGRERGAGGAGGAYLG